MTEQQTFVDDLAQVCWMHKTHILLTYCNNFVAGLKTNTDLTELLLQATPHLVTLSIDCKKSKKAVQRFLVLKTSRTHMEM